MTTFSELQTQIRDYTETSSDVLTDIIINDFIIQLQTPTITYDEKLNFYKEKYKEDNRYKDLSDEDLEKEILSNVLLKEELDKLK